MGEDLALVTELAIILISAGIFTIISKVLKQPLILGYIVAGFLVGPHLGLFPQFSTESVSQWSEIGIIFLLFSLGLEFSFKKLIKAGSAAIITALINCVGMFMLGIIAGRALGWAMMESIFLGGLMSMSSTTIIIKAYDDMGLKKTRYSGLVFSILVVEDLIAVLLMVLLSTLAISNKFAGAEMLMGVGKLVFFLVLWFLVGIYIIPTVLKKAKAYLSNEILLLVSIGLCFLMVVLANAVGFSSALGAFVMGSILSETIEAERIEHLTSSLKDLFGAVFFVSVGMMLDPAVLHEHWLPILVITLVAMSGKLFFSVAGVLLSGRNLDTGTHVGFSLAQLGEFSFIIAGLGSTLGVMREFIYPVIIAVSVITTFLTPYMIKAANPTLGFLRRRLPSILLQKIDFEEVSDASQLEGSQSDWKLLLKNYFLRLGLYAVVMVAIEAGGATYFGRITESLLPAVPDFWRRLICCSVTLVMMAPFIYGMNHLSHGFNVPAARLIKEKSMNAWPIISMVIFRVLLSMAFVVVPILKYFDLSGWALVLIAVGVWAVIFFSRKYLFVSKSLSVEQRFLENLNAKERQSRNVPVAESETEDAAADSQQAFVMEWTTLKADSYLTDKLLMDTSMLQTGCMVVSVVRHGKTITGLKPDFRFMTGDSVCLAGPRVELKRYL